MSIGHCDRPESFEFQWGEELSTSTTDTICVTSAIGVMLKFLTVVIVEKGSRIRFPTISLCNTLRAVATSDGLVTPSRPK